MIDPKILSSSIVPHSVHSISAQDDIEDIVHDSPETNHCHTGKLARGFDDQALPDEDDHQLLEIADIVNGTQSLLSLDNMKALLDPVFKDVGTGNIFEAVQANNADFEQFMGLPHIQFLERLSRINVVRHSHNFAMHMPVG